jgi:hypothetical protein
LVAIGLLLVTVASAGAVYQNRESHIILLKYCLFPWQQADFEPIQFPNYIARPYDWNTTRVMADTGIAEKNCKDPLSGNGLINCSIPKVTPGKSNSYSNLLLSHRTPQQ